MDLRAEKYFFVIQHRHDNYDFMPFSIAKTWFDSNQADIAIYLMYDAVQIATQEYLANRPDIKEIIDYLTANKIAVYACGFCTRVNRINPDNFDLAIQVANRHIYYSLMVERKVLYY
jgi:sulfur relay (sulfurtransferase) complex TusBCD TusD component (DsrE family)